jgi:hypothetical protein
MKERLLLISKSFIDRSQATKPQMIPMHAESSHLDISAMDALSILPGPRNVQSRPALSAQNTRGMGFIQYE